MPHLRTPLPLGADDKRPSERTQTHQHLPLSFGVSEAIHIAFIERRAEINAAAIARAGADLQSAAGAQQLAWRCQIVVGDGVHHRPRTGGVKS
jgi:hypothetical protein